MSGRRLILLMSVSMGGFAGRPDGTIMRKVIAVTALAAGLVLAPSLDAANAQDSTATEDDENDETGLFGLAGLPFRDYWSRSSSSMRRRAVSLMSASADSSVGVRWSMSALRTSVTCWRAAVAIRSAPRGVMISDRSSLVGGASLLRDELTLFHPTQLLGEATLLPPQQGGELERPESPVVCFGEVGKHLVVGVGDPEVSAQLPFVILRPRARPRIH